MVDSITQVKYISNNSGHKTRAPIAYDNTGRLVSQEDALNKTLRTFAASNANPLGRAAVSTYLNISTYVVYGDCDATISREDTRADI